jgi:phage shock protein A
MTNYNLALAKMAGVAERLKSQVKQKATRAQDLERRILANHRAGNMELAGTLARELQELKGDLVADGQELQETEEAYQANLRQAKVSQKDFEEKIRKLEKQLSQVKIKEAQAEAASALSSVAFKVGDLGDTMKRAEEVLQKRYEVSAGKARVAKDMVNMEQIQEKENERKALEQNALAEFLASQGIQTPATDARLAPKIGPKDDGRQHGPAALHDAASCYPFCSPDSSRSARGWCSDDRRPSTRRGHRPTRRPGRLRRWRKSRSKSRNSRPRRPSS